jgi:hypothetical protein
MSWWRRFWRLPPVNPYAGLAERLLAERRANANR